MPFVNKINTLKGLVYDPIIRHEISYQGADSIAGVFSTFTHSWLACGAKIFVINHSDGSIQSSWTFGEKPTDLVEITCAIELQFEGCSIPLLIVGVCSEQSNKICFFNPNTRKIIRTIECNFPIRVLCIVEDGLNDVNPLNEALTYTQGLLAVGCADGSLYAVDLCRNLLLKALNGDFRFVSDEQNPASVHVIDVTSVTSSGIQDTLKECYTNQASLAVLLSDDCDDGVTALCYSFESAVLYVGTSAGSFLLWNMTNLSCIFHSPNTSKAVISLSLLEPCDDPMHNLYLWVCYENHPHVVMYSISFTTKFFVPGYGVYYQGFESAGLVYKLVLGQNANLVVQRAVNSLAVAKSIPKNHAKTFKISDSESTQLRLFVTGLEVLSDGVEETRAVVFDLNQWYKEQLPEEGLSSCVELVDLGPGGLSHLALDPSSLAHYQWVRPLEQHFHPSALDFRLCCIEDEGIRCLEKLGLQSQWLRNMSIVGPSALLSPQQIFHGAISAGLLPTFIDPPDPEYTTVEEERKYILTVCLENRATSVIEHCALEWSTGSHPVAGCTLGFLIDWLWELHGIYKSQGNKMCVPLFDQSGLVFDISERKSLQHCKSLLTTVQTLYTNIIRKYSNFVLTDGLEQKLAAMSLVKFYFDCCLKLISVNLLPEPSEAGRPAGSISYKYHEINNFVSMKRKEGPFLGDTLVGRSGGEKEWEEEGGTGRYPPPSIQSVLRYCLHPAPSTASKLSLMLYLYTDILNSHTPLRDQGNIDKVKNFQYLLKIPDVQYKIVIAFWYLDHNLFYEGTSLLFDPRILPVDVTDDQHRSILRLLSLQGQEKLGLQYLRLKASDLHQLDDFRLELDLLLSNRLINEAFMFQRKHPEYREELLIQFFQGCIEKKLLGQVFGLHLDPKEESVLFKFLKTSDLQNKNDLQVLLLLSRAKYTEAVSLNDRINSTVNGPKARLETDTRDMIVRGITGGLNTISKDLAQEMRLYRPPPAGTCPRPLSALIKIRSEPDGPLLQSDSRILLSAAAKSTRHLSDYVNIDERSRKRCLDEDENMDIDMEAQPRKKPALWTGLVRDLAAPSTPLKSSGNQEREVMELVGTPLVKKRGKRISPHSKPSSILKAKTPQRGGQIIDEQGDTPSRKTLRFALPESEKQVMSGRALFSSEVQQTGVGEQSGITKTNEPLSERVSGRKSLRSVRVPDEPEKVSNENSTVMETIRDHLRSSKSKLLGDGAVDWKHVAESSQPKVLFTPGSSKNPVKSALRGLPKPSVAATPPVALKVQSPDILISSPERKYLASPSRETEVSPMTQAIFTTSIVEKLFPIDNDEDEDEEESGEEKNAHQESSLEKYKRLRSQNAFFKKSKVNESEETVKEKCIIDNNGHLNVKKDSMPPANIEVASKESDVCEKKLLLTSTERENIKSGQEYATVKAVYYNLDSDTDDQDQDDDKSGDHKSEESENDNEEDDRTSQEGSTHHENIVNDDSKTEMERLSTGSINPDEEMLHIGKVLSGTTDMFPLKFGLDSGSASQPKGESSKEPSSGKKTKTQKTGKDTDSDVICLSSSDEENEEDKSSNENSNESSPSYSSQEFDAEPQTGFFIDINSESECDEYTPNESEEDLGDAEYADDGEDVISRVIGENAVENIASSIITDDFDSEAGSRDVMPSRIPAEFYAPNELNDETEARIVIMGGDSDEERPYDVADLLSRHNMIPDPFLSDIVPIKVASKYEKKCEKSSLPKKENQYESSETAGLSESEIISTGESESSQKESNEEYCANESTGPELSTIDKKDSTKKIKTPESSSKKKPEPPVTNEKDSSRKLDKAETSAVYNLPEIILSSEGNECLEKLNIPESSVSQRKTKTTIKIEEYLSRKMKKTEASDVHITPEIILPSEKNETSKKCNKSDSSVSRKKSGATIPHEENSSKKIKKVEASVVSEIILSSDESEIPKKINKPECVVSQKDPEVTVISKENSSKKLKETEPSNAQNVPQIILLSEENATPQEVKKPETSTNENTLAVILPAKENSPEKLNKTESATEKVSKPGTRADQSKMNVTSRTEGKPLKSGLLQTYSDQNKLEIIPTTEGSTSGQLNRTETFAVESLPFEDIKRCESFFKPNLAEIAEQRKVDEHGSNENESAIQSSIKPKDLSTQTLHKNIDNSVIISKEANIISSGTSKVKSLEEETKDVTEGNNIVAAKLDLSKIQKDIKMNQQNQNLEETIIYQNIIREKEPDKDGLGKHSSEMIPKDIEQSKISSSSSEDYFKSEMPVEDQKQNKEALPTKSLGKEILQREVIEKDETNITKEFALPVECKKVDSIFSEIIVEANNTISLQMEDVSSTSENNNIFCNKESTGIQSSTKHGKNTSISKVTEQTQSKENINSDNADINEFSAEKVDRPVSEESSCYIQPSSNLHSQGNLSHPKSNKMSTSDGSGRLEPRFRDLLEPSLEANNLKNENLSVAQGKQVTSNDDVSFTGSSNKSFSSIPPDGNSLHEPTTSSDNSTEKPSVEQIKIDSQSLEQKPKCESINRSTKQNEASLESETKESLVSSTSKPQSKESGEESRTCPKSKENNSEKGKSDSSYNKQSDNRGDSSKTAESSPHSDVAADSGVQMKSFFFGRDEKNETYLRTTERVTFQVGSRASMPSEDEPVDPLETAMIEEAEEEDNPAEENVLPEEYEETDPRNTCMLEVDLSLRLSEDDLIGKPLMVDKGTVTTNSYLSVRGRKSIRSIENSKDTKAPVDTGNPEVTKSEKKKLPGLLLKSSEKVHDENDNDKNKLEKQSFGTQTSDSFFSNKDDHKMCLDSKVSKVSGNSKASSVGLQDNSKIASNNEVPDLNLDTSSNNKGLKQSRSSVCSQVPTSSKEELKGILKNSSKVSQSSIRKNRGNEDAGMEVEVYVKPNKEEKFGTSEACKETRVSRRSRRSSVSSQSSEVAQDLKSRLEELSENNRPSKELDIQGILKKGHSLKKTNDVGENSEKRSRRKNSSSDDEAVSKEKNSRKSDMPDTVENTLDYQNAIDRKRRSARHSLEPELRGILKNKTEVKRRGSCTSESATDMLKRLEEDFPEVKKRSRRVSEEPELPGILKKTEGRHSRSRKSLSTNDISCESKNKFQEELNRLKEMRNKPDISQTSKAGSSHNYDQDLCNEKHMRRPRRLSEEPQVHGILKNKSETKYNSIAPETSSDLQNRLNDDLPENRRRRRRHSVDVESLTSKADLERKHRRHSHVADDVIDDYDAVKRRLRSYSEEPELRGILKNCPKRKSSSHTFETNRDFKVRLEEDFPEEKKTRRRRHSVDSDFGTKDLEKPVKKGRRHSCTSDEGSAAENLREKGTKLPEASAVLPEEKSTNENRIKLSDDDRYLTTAGRVAMDIDSPAEKKGRGRRKSLSEEPVEVRRSSRQTTPDNRHKSPNPETKRKLTVQKDSLVSKKLEFSEDDSPIVTKKSKSLQDFPIRRSTRLHPILENIEEEEEDETPVKKKRKSFDDLEAQKVKDTKLSKIKEDKKFPSLVIVNSDEDDDDMDQDKDNWTESYAKERRLTRTQKKVLMRNTALMEGLSPLTPTPESSTPKKGRRRPSESPPRTPTRTSLRLQKKPPSEPE